MYFYVSKNHDRLNGKPFRPELVGERVCLNPKYRATVDTRRRPKVLLDSGAFQDRHADKRLTFGEALTRQLDFEEERGFTSELIVSYDRLVDEAEGSLAVTRSVWHTQRHASTSRRLYRRLSIWWSTGVI